MSFISYAQNFEDVMLWRALKHIENGFYIDVGANHPLDDSVTKAFYNYGWNGINIEPEEKFFEMLQLDRKRDINLDVAVSNRSEDITLYIFEIRGWTTNDLNVAKQHKAEGHKYKTKTIKTKSLDQICKENSVAEVHFLKIDVEGVEKDVLESFSLQETRPWIIVIEATKPNTAIDVSHNWEYILLEQSYQFAYFDGINKFYVAKERSELLNAFHNPPNAFDDFISINQYNAQISHQICETKLKKTILQTEQTHHSIENLQHHYQAILDSNSWKITKPMRLLSDILHRSKIGISNHIKQEKKQLLVDVSQIYFDDNQTGIQRVIHNILFELSALSLDRYDLLPVYATKGETYRYTDKFHQHNMLLSKLNEKVVTVQKGDIFLGLDLTAHLFPHIETTLEEYRQNGASINYIVYDIIPLLYPQYTTEGMDEYFRVWLGGLVKCADRLICISHSVALELQRYIEEHSPSSEHLPKITSFHLGAGIDINSGLQGLRAEETSLLQRIKMKPTFLMVGTVEPRKGCYQTLLAFEELWAKGMDINLVIIGKSGWMVEGLLLRLDTHPQSSRHLFWLQGVSDDFLCEIYTSSSCLIAASKTEGFGLPLIEAAKYNLPLIARNIPVFKEIAQEYAFYFDDNDQADTIAKAVTDWLEQYKSDTYPHSKDISWLTWKESALQLMESLDSAKASHQE